jgi:hypothetical protein
VQQRSDLFRLDIRAMALKAMRSVFDEEAAEQDRAPGNAATGSAA